MIRTTVGAAIVPVGAKITNFAKADGCRGYAHEGHPAYVISKSPTRVGLFLPKAARKISWCKTLGLIPSTVVDYDPDVSVGDAFGGDLEALIEMSQALGLNVGTDPEIFIEHGNGELFPAYEFLPGKKQTPNAFVYNDGFQAEFNTGPGTMRTSQGMYCHNYVTADMYYALTALLAKARLTDPTAKLTPRTVVDVSEAVRASAKDEHVQLGCAPSLNVYEGTSPLPQIDGRALPVRFAGCHLHYSNIQDPQLTTEQKLNGVRALDAIAGVASVSLFAGLEDPIRRQFYGRAGEYRLPKHGLEWRVLSSMVLCHPAAAHLMLDLSRAAYRIGVLGMLDTAWKASPEEVVAVINNYDVEGARAILKRNEEFLLALLRHRYNNAQIAQAALDTLMHGITSAISDPWDVEGNWQLGKIVDEDYRPIRNPYGAKCKFADYSRTTVYAECRERAGLARIDGLVCNTPVYDD